MTPPNSDIFNPSYGAGLGSFVGSPINVNKVKADISSQIMQEDFVTSINYINLQYNASNYSLFVQISYIDNQNSPISLQFNLN